MPNILMSVINDTRKQKYDEKREYEKRMKIAEKNEKKLNKVISNAVGINP